MMLFASNVNLKILHKIKIYNFGNNTLVKLRLIFVMLLSERFKVCNYGQFRVDSS
jgi:hypothetical protein